LAKELRELQEAATERNREMQQEIDRLKKGLKQPQDADSMEV
jgi:hypothetical protein